MIIISLLKQKHSKHQFKILNLYSCSLDTKQCQMNSEQLHHYRSPLSGAAWWNSRPIEVKHCNHTSCIISPL